VIGVILAAGAGTRLAPLTDELPKTLLDVAGDRSILDVALANLAAAGIADVVVVTGVCGDRIGARAEALERRHGVRIELIDNPRAREWNNAYSLWRARAAFGDGMVLVNGDTVHPGAIEEDLLALSSDAPAAGLVLAVDDRKPVRDEAMKVSLTPAGLVGAISKGLAPPAADGEYVGVALLRPAAAGALADALEATWRRDPSLYYEDAFQVMVDRGDPVGVAIVGAIDWVEVDDHADLARAREIACRF
jgi:choline kinase